MLRYLFRKPLFPIICNIDNYVFSARTEHDFLKKITTLKFDQKLQYDVIDFNIEGWSFVPDLMVISPLTIKKNWTKKEINDLVNNRNNKNNKKPYILKLYKQLNVIFSELVEYIED
jgi:hypothetical protein